MNINKLYRIRKKSSISSKAVYLRTQKKWDDVGRFFTGTELLNFLSKLNKSMSTTDKFPDEWEVVDYQLVETNTKPIEQFIKFNSKSPWIKGL